MLDNAFALIERKDEPDCTDVEHDTYSDVSQGKKCNHIIFGLDYKLGQQSEALIVRLIISGLKLITSRLRLTTSGLRLITSLLRRSHIQ